MPRGSSWMMLVGAGILAVGVALAGISLLLSIRPAAPRTLDPGESISESLSVRGGDSVYHFIAVLGHGPGEAPLVGDTVSVNIRGPSGGVICGSGGSAGIQQTGTCFIREGGSQTIVIQNTGVRSLTLDYRISTTDVEALWTASFPLAFTGLFVLVAGLGLRFVGRGVRRFWES